MVGSLFIESGRKPEKTIQAIEVLSTPASEPVAGMDQDRELLQKITDSLSHGDLVRATFEQPPHGRFTVIGIAVSTADDEILAAGGWFLAYQGVTALRMKELVVIAAAGTHHVSVPAHITAWESEEAVD